MPQKPTTIVTGTVDGINIPAEWKEGQYGMFKSCGIKLINCNKPGISWINYFWNQKNKAGEEQGNLFENIRKGQTYNFICTSKVYQDKVQYVPQSYELVLSGGGAPAHTEEEKEIDEPVSTPVTSVPKNDTVKKCQITGYEYSDGRGWLVVVSEDGSVLWVAC